MSFELRRVMPMLFALSAAATTAGAQVAADVSALAVPAGTTASARSLLASQRGQVQVVVRLKDAPLAAVAGNKKTGMKMTADQQRAYVQKLADEQAALAAQLQSYGAQTLASVKKSHNALVISVDAQQLPAISRLPGVSKIRPVVDYEMHLGETVPYVGAAAVQNAGKDGTGIRIAVLDSGIDYMHRNLGGPGTVADYVACYGTPPGGSEAGQPRNAAPVGNCANFFGPSAPKVIGGYDFVGEQWPTFGPRTEDPNPIDFGTHGTHVADIIAGRSADGTHKGVAPGAKLYAVKVCSAVATSCNGIALLLGMDFALDPNDDGDLADAVDVINMSLGSSYGQREDDLSEASAIASRFGVTVVASAGNSADRPFIAGSPSTTPEVISVAQTQVPSAKAIPLVVNSPASIAGTYGNTATIDWAPIGAGVTGDVAYVGRGCNADTYLADPAGKVALIDRGACNISEKVRRATLAGAAGVLIGLVAAGDAVSFSNGGECNNNCVASLVITQATSNLIKANLAAPVNVTMSSAFAIPLVGSMAASSSRGPGYSYGSIKPDIGAPGASVSAIAGSGAAEEAFGGTSGSAPMVSGAAALLLQAVPALQPHEVKARLMNAAERNILTNPATQPGLLAPITRIGAGELRVDRSLALTTSIWDGADPGSVSLSVGAYRTIGTQVFRKRVMVRNYANVARSYAIANGFRYANDQASGALAVSTPGSISVPANGTASFIVTMTLNSNLLPTWNLNGGSSGGNGALLNLPEYDGYITLTDANDTVSLPWHLLPHKGANVRPAASSVSLANQLTGSLGLTNSGGAVAGRTDVFMLTGTSPQLPSATLPRPGDNFAIIDLKSVGVRLVSIGGGAFGVQFAVNTYGERSHPNYPAEFDVFIDNNNDGVDDFLIFNGELGTFASSGQNVVNVLNLATNQVAAFFFTDADLSSANAILTAPLANLGLTPGTKFTFTVLAGDNYFTGVGTDLIGPMQVTLDTPRFFGSIPGGSTPINGANSMSITRDPAGDTASPSQTGLLLMHRDARKGLEADAITVTP
jgi:minor extracellular serine protease Vpr